MKWRRILLLTFLLVVVLGGATWMVLQQSDAATVAVRRELAARLLTPVALAGTELDLALGRLSLHGLAIDDPTRPGQPLLRIAHADLDVDADPLGGTFGLHSVQAAGVELDLGPDLPSLQQLLREPAAAAGGAPGRVPPLLLRRATLRYTAVRGAEPIVVEDLAIDVMPVRGPGTRLQITGTASLAGAGARLHVVGAVDLDAGEGKIRVSVRDCAIHRALVETFAARFGLDARGIDVAARLDEVEVVFGVRREGADAKWSVELDGRLSGVRVSAPGFPPQIRNADVALGATTAEQGKVTLHLTQSTEKGDLDLRAEVAQLAGTPDWAVRANGRDLMVDGELFVGLAAFPLGQALGRALQATAGRGDIDIYLRNCERSGGVAEFDMTLRGVSMAFQGFGEGEDQLGFPMPLVDARGRVRLHDDIVWLEGLQASIDPEAGGGTVSLDGRIATLAPAGEETTLDIRAKDVSFSDHLRTSLDALLHDAGDLYDRLSPAGKATVTVNVRPRSQLAGGWSVDLEPRGATMQWANFPYALGELEGTVAVRAGGASFDLAGRHGEGRLQLRGRVPLTADSPDGVGDFAAVLQLDDVAVDDDLRAAVAVLAPSLDAPWRDSAPSGRFDGVVRVSRPSPRDPLQYDARLDLGGVDLLLPSAPWRATQLHGQIVVQGAGEASRVDFSALHGQIEHGGGKAGRLAMLGSLVQGATPSEDLTFVARDFALDPQVGRTLEDIGALARGTWENLRPSGTVDLVCRVQHTAGSAPQLSLDVQLVDVGCDAPMLPKPARHIVGELTVADGELRISDLRGEVGGTVVHTRAGRVAGGDESDDRTTMTFEVAATGFPVDGDLANLFSGPLRTAITERQLAGRADIDSMSLAFKVPPAGSRSAFETVLEGQFRLYDVGMTLGTGPDGLRIEAMNGVVSLDRSAIGDDGGSLTGMLRGGSLRIFGQPFESIEAPFAADAKHLELVSLDSRFHGGTVSHTHPARPAVDYLLPGPESPQGRLSAALAFEKADVLEFLTRCGWQNPQYSGSASGSITLERLDGNDLVNAVGSGSLHIERGDLGVVPLFASIYAQLPVSERPHFEKLAMQFRLADRRFTFDPLQLDSQLLAANGRGSLDLDGYLDVEMKLDNLLGRSADPLLMPLIDYLTQNIVRFHLFGHLRDLRAEKRWVTERSPTRREILPMPPFRERRAIPDY